MCEVSIYYSCEKQLIYTSTAHLSQIYSVCDVTQYFETELKKERVYSKKARVLCLFKSLISFHQFFFLISNNQTRTKLSLHFQE